MAQFDVQAAKRDGMTDQQIQSFMASKNLTPVFRTGEFAGNVLKSGGRLIGNIASGLWNLPSTIGQVASGQTSLKDIGKGIGQDLKNRYGGWDEIARTAYFDPAGTLADASIVAGGAGAALKGAGALSKTSGLTRAGKTLSKVGRNIDPVVQAGRATRGGLQKLGAGMRKYGQGYTTAGIGNPAKIKEANDILKGVKIPDVDPRTGKQITRSMTVNDLIGEGNLYSRSTGDLVEFSKKLKNEFDILADNPNLRVKITDVTAPLDDLIEQTRQAIKDFPSERAYQIQLQELTRQKQNIARKASGGVIPGNEALRLRRELDAVLSPSASAGVAQRPGEMLAKQKLVSGLRGGLRQADPRLTALGKKMQAIGFEGKEGPLMSAFKGYESRAAVRNPITLSGVTTSGVGAGIGAMLGGPVGAVAGGAGAGLVKGAVSSPRGIQAVSRGSQALGSGVASSARKASPYLRTTMRTAGQPARMVDRSIASTNSQAKLQEESRLKSKLTTPSDPFRKETIKPTISPVAPKIKSTMPTAESFYAEIRKKRGY